MELKFATTDEEREAIFRLRYDVYITERGEDIADHEPVGETGGRLADAVDASSRLIYAVDDDRVVGSMRITWGGEAEIPEKWQTMYDLERFTTVVGPERIAVMSKFVVLPDYRGAMLPFRLLAKTAEFCLDTSVALVFVDCQPYLLDLYHQLGFRSYTDPENDPAVGISVPLVMVCEDFQYLREIRSPLLHLAKGREIESDIPARVVPLLRPTVQVVEEEDAERWARAFGFLSAARTRNVSIFQDMTEDEIGDVIGESQVITCEAGSQIIAEGVSDDTLYIVLAGCVSLRVDDRPAAVIARGGVVDELAYLLGENRSVDAVAVSDEVTILCLNETTLGKLLVSNSDIAAKFYRNLARVVGLKLANLRRGVYQKRSWGLQLPPI